MTQPFYKLLQSPLVQCLLVATYFELRITVGAGVYSGSKRAVADMHPGNLANPNLSKLTSLFAHLGLPNTSYLNKKFLLLSRNTFFFFTRSWSERPVWSLQSRLGSHHIPPSHHTALFHSGHSPAPRHPALSRLTAGRSTLQRKKTQHSQSQLHILQTGKDRHTHTLPTRHVHMLSITMLLCIATIFISLHFSWCLICTIGTLVCPDLFHVNRTRTDEHLVTDPPSGHGGSNYQLVVLSTACCLILRPPCCLQQATIMKS